MDKTVKIRAFGGEGGTGEAARSEPAEDKHKIDLAMKDAQIEEERSRALEHLKTIVQLRESMKQEQAKSAELAKRVEDLEVKIRAIANLEAGEVAARNAQLEAEKSKSQEYQKIVEQLRDSLRQEQARTAALSKNVGEQENMARDLAALQEKVKDIPALEARVREIPALEAKIQELSVLQSRVQELAELEARVAGLKEILGKISTLAAAGTA